MKVYQEGGLRYKLQTLDDNVGSVKVYQLYKKILPRKGNIVMGDVVHMWILEIQGHFKIVWKEVN